MTDLLPCPFCGGNAKANENDIGETFSVECDYCAAEADTVALWNTRPQLEAVNPVTVKPLPWRDSYGVLRADLPGGTWMIKGKIGEFSKSSFSMMLGDDPKAEIQAKHNEFVESLVEPSAIQPADVIKVSVLTMALSGNREEYYVQISYGGRTIETRNYSQGFKNRAEYEAAELRHVLLNEPKPDLLDPKYDDPETIQPEAQDFNAGVAQGIAQARLVVSQHFDWNPSTVRADLLLNIDMTCDGTTEAPSCHLTLAT